MRARISSLTLMVRADDDVTKYEWNTAAQAGLVEAMQL